LFVSGNGVSLSAGFHFESALFDLDFFGPAFGLFEPGCRLGDLSFAGFAFFREMSDFGLIASKTLVAILQGEQLFDHIKHLRMMIGPLEIIQRAVWRVRRGASSRDGRYAG
jgi:hypothetical protein